MISKPDANKKNLQARTDLTTLALELEVLEEAATTASSQGIRCNYVASSLFHRVQTYEVEISAPFRESLSEQRKGVTAARAKLEDALRDVRVLEATLTELAGTPERAAA